jgi:hypothetical protein
MTLSEWASRWGCSGQALSELMQIVASTPDATHQSGTGGSEAALQSTLRVHAPTLGFALWRNNNGACRDDTGRLIRYGLGNDSAKLNKRWKSSDLIGVGPGGRFVAVEVKSPGWHTPRNEREHAQANFINTVRALGGCAGFATSVVDYERIVRQWPD